MLLITLALVPPSGRVRFPKRTFAKLPRSILSRSRLGFTTETYVRGMTLTQTAVTVSEQRRERGSGGGGE